MTRVHLSPKQNYLSMLGLFQDLNGWIRNPTKPLRSPVICMYHSISKEATRDWGPWQYGLTPDEFEKQIRYLDSQKNIISLAELVKYLVGDGVVPDNSVVITFDDGYRNYRSRALPILEQYDAPSTVYVSTRLMTEEVAPYEHRLAVALLESDNICFDLDGETYQYDVSTERASKELYSELRPRLKQATQEYRESFLDKLGRVEPDSPLILTPEMVRQLGQHQHVTVGSHSHEHRPHAALDVVDVQRNIKKSTEILTDILDRPIRHFSFPYGSVSRVSSQVVEQEGYESAVTTTERSIRPRDWGYSYSLPRFDMSSIHPSEIW